MAEPFIGEIKLFGFGFAPRNYVACDGRLLPINQYQALFSLLGARYGGNGVQNFAVPDLRGRTPLHFAPATISIGMREGVDTAACPSAGRDQSDCDTAADNGRCIRERRFASRRLLRAGQHVAARIESDLSAANAGIGRSVAAT